MLSKKLKDTPSSKLEKTVAKITKDQEAPKTGFIKKPSKTSLFKTKSFRLREADLSNFENIISYINNNDNDRRQYSDSQILRGLINYLSDNMDSNFKKIVPYVRSSS
jgi:hypothetical protein